MKVILSVVITAAIFIKCQPGTSTPGVHVAKKESVGKMDAVNVSPEKFKVLLENKQVRVIEYTLKPGEKDNWHTHPAKVSYVVSGGELKIYADNKEAFTVVEKTGTASWMDEVGKHFVENIGETVVTIVLTELKPVN